jgi:hypothetical protein
MTGVAHVRLRRWALIAVLSTAAAVASVAPALAAWSASGIGTAAGAATTMPAGQTPSASAGRTNATVFWPAASFANGAAVAGYLVNRYDAATGALQTIGAACSGLITTTTCTENNVPSGTWEYTDTPVQGGWTGASSSLSNPITVP